MKKWTKEAMEVMVNNHVLFENSSKSAQMAKVLLLIESDNFYMTVETVQQIAKFIQ